MSRNVFYLLRKRPRRVNRAQGSPLGQLRCYSAVQRLSVSPSLHAIRLWACCEGMGRGIGPERDHIKANGAFDACEIDAHLSLSRCHPSRHQKTSQC